MTRQFGCRTLDKLLPHFRCPKCGDQLAAPALVTIAEVALEHFTRGEALAPEDPDYPLGRARALIRLRRMDEAREACERGRELAPEHPRIAEIEAALAGT